MNKNKNGPTKRFYSGLKSWAKLSFDHCALTPVDNYWTLYSIWFAILNGEVVMKLIIYDVFIITSRRIHQHNSVLTINSLFKISPQFWLIDPRSANIQSKIPVILDPMEFTVQSNNLLYLEISHRWIIDDHLLISNRLSNNLFELS